MYQRGELMAGEYLISTGWGDGEKQERQEWAGWHGLRQVLDDESSRDPRAKGGTTFALGRVEGVTTICHGGRLSGRFSP